LNTLLVRGLRHRFLSAAFVSIPLADTCVSYVGDGNPWRILGMLGWLVFGSAWFLRPVVFSRAMLSPRRQGATLALISQRQWRVLVGLGILAVAAALVGRYANAG
jgi:hypothetical protein